ncbi:hypothetical protein ACH3PA_07205 [Leeuwenhoekiella sp. A2]|uniref:hypothetical protein n=1 Tax=Leeuwenhoekiella sp. A2 TaxID=3141460 RepID=UPI003A810F7D
MRLHTLEKLKQDFEKALEKTTAKEYLIENELKAIEGLANPDNLKYHAGIDIDIFGNPKLQSTDRTFILNISKGLKHNFALAYKSYYSTGAYTPVRHEQQSDESYNNEIVLSEQARIYVQYHKWLKQLLSQPNEIKQTTSKSNLTHKEKILSLYYMGLRFDTYENTKYAKLLSLITGDSEEATRQHLSNFHKTGNTIKKVKTEKGLKKLQQLFENLGFEEELNLVNKDIKQI